MMDAGYFHQVLICVASGFSVASCLFIMNFTTFGVTSMENDKEFHITPDQAILVGSIIPFMGLFGNILAGFLVDYLGRKHTMVAGNILHILGCIIAAVGTDARQVLVGRAINGVAFNLTQISSMIYGAEVIHPSVRDRLNSIIGIMATVGSTIPFMIANSLEWRELIWCGAVLMLPSLVILTKLPKSPVYLIKIGKISEAKSSLEWFRSSSTEATKELKDIEESFRSSQDSSFDLKSMFKAPYRTPVIAGLLLLIAQQGTGITAFMAYISQITSEMGFQWSSMLSIVMVTISIAPNFACAEINLRFDRKLTLLVTSTICVMLQLFIGVFFWLKDTDSYLGRFCSANSYLAIVSLFLFIAVFNVGLGPIPFIYLGEGMPTKIRGPASSFCFTINTLVIGSILQIYKPFADRYGYQTVFFSFALTSTLLVGMVYPIMLETRGKSVAEIDEYYNNLEKKKTD